ncbi:hypothetical protein FA048_11055 [Pedobacter polaris]|uniref:MmpS family membrane protein n=1 Tax=Pedobacter polaris TaxID=2571273 RepID=A0A4V5P060_9SPHI|nr:MmpS family transport accessory protein [Pedobacter polaris]TKC10702.1 hypothetical protein FA048_11055 [Pedobacter polaris]
MKTTLIKNLVGLFMLALAFTSCGKDDDSNGPQSKSKKVKYEITGNYTGQFMVVYIQANGSNETVTVSQLPWSAEITVSSFPSSAGFGVNAVTNKPGIAGQTAKSTIYVDGVAVQTGTQQTAGTDGYIFTMPTLPYVVK